MTTKNTKDSIIIMGIVVIALVTLVIISWQLITKINSVDQSLIYQNEQQNKTFNVLVNNSVVLNHLTENTANNLSEISKTDYKILQELIEINNKTLVAEDNDGPVMPDPNCCL